MVPDPVVSVPHVWRSVPPPPPGLLCLSYCLFFTKSGKTVRGEKHTHDWDSVAPLLSAWERVKEATAHTAQRLAACSTSSSWLAVLRQTAVAPDLSFSPSDSLRETQKRANIFGQLYFRALRQSWDSIQYRTREWPAPLCCFCFFFFFLAFFVWHSTAFTLPLISHYLKLSDDIGISCFIFSHCFTVSGLKMWLMTVWLE